MAQYRNVTDSARYVVTPTGLVKVDADEILTIPDDFAESRYWQTGETGEPQMWEHVTVTAPRGKNTKNTDPEPAVEAED